MSGLRQEAQEVLGEGERLLDEANQLSDNINKELEVLHLQKPCITLKPLYTLEYFA